MTESIAEFAKTSLYFGFSISVAAYFAGTLLQRRFRHPALNPLLLSVIFVIILLTALKIEYAEYYESAKYISYLLTPSTICLAVPLYENITLLKKDGRAITAGIIAGTLTSLVSIFVLSKLLALKSEQYVTLLPKSVTTAIGASVSEELGGLTAITTAAIIITGIAGSLMSDTLCRLLKITEPVAKGLALGTSSHAVGTAKAFELGEAEGAISSLSVVAAGVITVILAPLFARLM
ncbi:LrgB family protein [Clostridia bacterium]|nr:LrgB family protein [Clostridia bacterium]